jgi:hypothetical protein
MKGELFLDKKWYHSKKFVTVIVTILSLFLNEYLGIGIDDQTLTVLVGVILTYILAQFGLDLKDKNKDKTSIQDPVVRDSIEALVSDFYDYAAAKDKGISEHSLEVKEKVMSGLELILDPKFHKDAKEISQEVIRLVMKFYREDQSMKKGADIVKNQVLKNAQDAQ